MPLDIPPMMNACPPEESYILPYDLFCQHISYVMVSFTLFLFISSSYISHHCIYNLLLCASVSFVSIWRYLLINKSLTISSAIPACASIFVKVFLNPCQGKFSMPKSFVDSIHSPGNYVPLVPHYEWKRAARLIPWKWGQDQGEPRRVF